MRYTGNEMDLLSLSPMPQTPYVILAICRNSSERELDSGAGSDETTISALEVVVDLYKSQAQHKDEDVSFTMGLLLEDLLADEPFIY